MSLAAVSAVAVFLFVALQARLSLVARPEDSRHLGDAVADAATLLLLAQSLVGTLLGLFGAYDTRLSLGLVLAWPVARTVLEVAGVGGRRRESISGATPPRLRPSRQGWALLVLLALFVAVSGERFEHPEMTQDPGIYVNLAKNLEAMGDNLLPVPIADALADAPARYADQVALLTAGLPGTYPVEDSPRRIYQFLLGWPVLLALGGALFGVPGATWILVPLALLAIYWFHRIVSHWLGGGRLFLATALFATNPLFFYFSKFPTSEMYLLVVVLYLVWVHLGWTPSGQDVGVGVGGPVSGRLVLAVAALGVTHISTFLYLPLLALHALWAAVGDRRDQLRAVAAVAAVFAAGLGLAFIQSPTYARHIFAYSFAEGSDFPHRMLPVLIVVSVLALGAAALAVSRRNPLAGRLSEDGTFAAASVALRLFLGVILAWTAWSAYRLAWTRDLVEGAPLRGAWVERSEYAGQGASALLHHNVVSIALGTGVVLFLVALAAALWPRRRPIADTADLFLAGGWSWLLFTYVALRADTPYNYYASRYFLPLLVPFVMLYGLKGMVRWRRPAFFLALAPVLAFNLVYTGFQVEEPEYQGRHDLVRQLEAAVPGDAVVAAVGDPQWVHYLVANLLLYDLQIDYAYLGGDRGRGLRRVGRLAYELGVDEVYLLLDRPVPGAGRVYTELSAFDRPYPHRALYPTEAPRAEIEMFLYRLPVEERCLDLLDDRVLDLSELAWLSPQSYEPAGQPSAAGDSTGSFDLELPCAVRVTDLVLETGGRARAADPADPALPLEVRINRGPVRRVELRHGSARVHVGRAKPVERVEVRRVEEVPVDGPAAGLDLLALRFGQPEP